MAPSARELVEPPWRLEPELARKLCRTLAIMEAETGLTWRIISGYRTPEEQLELQRQGRPAAPVDLSTHTVCPSQGADVSVATFPTTAMKAQFGRVATEQGLRWGGGSPVDPDTGIPFDWNHVDLGPRRQP